MGKMIYLDNAATTKAAPEVVEAMLPYFTEFYGNASTVYEFGAKSKEAVSKARETIANAIGAKENEVYFTAGGSEADNWAIKATAEAYQGKGKHIITSKIEHHAVLHTCQWLEQNGFEVTYLDVDEFGVVKLEELKKAIRPDTILISIMFANNEIGTIEPVEEIGKIAKEHGILFHTDAVQAFGQVPIDVDALNIDMLSSSGHKLNGPKGVGFLYIRKGLKLRSFIHGGAQERKRRAGTENVPGIAGMARAVEEIFVDFDAKINYLYGLKEQFIKGVRMIDGIRINGPEGRDGAPHVVSVSIQGVRSEVMLHALGDKGIYVSAGSACSSNKPSVSATLKAIGVEKQFLDATLRFSFSLYTTETEIDYTVKALCELVPMLRRYTRK